MKRLLFITLGLIRRESKSEILITNKVTCTSNPPPLLTSLLKLQNKSRGRCCSWECGWSRGRALSLLHPTRASGIILFFKNVTEATSRHLRQALSSHPRMISLIRVRHVNLCKRLAIKTIDVHAIPVEDDWIHI